MKGVLITVVSVLPYAIGWMAGNCVRFARWFKGVMTIGYLEGSKDTVWQQTLQRYSRK